MDERVPTDRSHSLQPTSADDDVVFEANRAWELDRAAMLERSERRGWIVGGIGALLAVLGVLAVFAQGPLRQVVGIPIVVDKLTGETTIQQRLSVESVPMREALDKHHLAVFVRAREGYGWWFLQRDFDQVARMAVPAVFADYSRQFEGDGALQKKLAGTEEWRIHDRRRAALAVRPARQRRRRDRDLRQGRAPHRPQPARPEPRHVASLVYEYQPKVLAKEKDRIENPLGFVVTAYRSDPEIAPPPRLRRRSSEAPCDRCSARRRFAAPRPLAAARAASLRPASEGSLVRPAGGGHPPVKRGSSPTSSWTRTKSITDLASGMGGDCSKPEASWCIAAQAGGRHVFVKPKSTAGAPNNLAMVTDKRTTRSASR